MTRYAITAIGAPGAKARIRTALRLMGFEAVRIEEREEEPQEPAPRPDNVPQSEAARAVASLYNREHGKPWAEDEIKAFKAAVKSTVLTAETVAIVAEFYRVERRRDGHFCRTSLLTFVRHFQSELDKARAAKPKNGRTLEWSQPKPEPAPDPQEQERIRLAALAQIAERRAKTL